MSYAGSAYRTAMDNGSGTVTTVKAQHYTSSGMTLADKRSILAVLTIGSTTVTGITVEGSGAPGGWAPGPTHTAQGRTLSLFSKICDPSGSEPPRFDVAMSVPIPAGIENEVATCIADFVTTGAPLRAASFDDGANGGTTLTLPSLSAANADDIYSIVWNNPDPVNGGRLHPQSPLTVRGSEGGTFGLTFWMENATEVWQSSGATGTRSWATPPGASYYEAAIGAMVLVGGVCTPPVNDSWANAIDLGSTFYGTVLGDNICATTEEDDPNGGDNIWWKWTAPASGVATFEGTENFEHSGTGEDFLDLNVWNALTDVTPSLGQLGEVPESEYPTQIPSYPAPPLIRFLAVEGVTYWISLSASSSPNWQYLAPVLPGFTHFGDPDWVNRGNGSAAATFTVTGTITAPELIAMHFPPVSYAGESVAPSWNVSLTLDGVLLSTNYRNDEVWPPSYLSAGSHTFSLAFTGMSTTPYQIEVPDGIGQPLSQTQVTNYGPVTLEWSLAPHAIGADLPDGGYIAWGIMEEEFYWIDMASSPDGWTWSRVHSITDGAWSSPNALVGDNALSLVGLGWPFLTQTAGMDPLGMIYSVDGGANWAPANSVMLHNGEYTEVGGGGFWGQYDPWSEDGRYGNDRFVVACQILEPPDPYTGDIVARILSCSSDNPSTWVTADIPALEVENSYIYQLGWMGDRFMIATISGPYPNYVWTYQTSLDGITWTALPDPPFDDSSPNYYQPLSLAGNGTKWLYLAQVSRFPTVCALYSSVNQGQTWTTETLPATFDELATNGSQWVATSSAHPSLWWSDDGVTWTPATANPFDTATQRAASVRNLHWDGDTWWAVGRSHASISPTRFIMRSSDGKNWTAVATPFDDVPSESYVSGVRKVGAAPPSLLEVGPHTVKLRRRRAS